MSNLILPHEVLEKFSKFQLKLKGLSENIDSGIHKSPFYGFNIEFFDYRQYFPGDDIKYIDWRLYGKFNKLYIKQFGHDTNMYCYIFLDTSGSMGYKSGSITKLDYSSSLAACIYYLLIKQGDKVAIATFDNKIKEYLSPQNKDLSLALRILSNTNPEGHSDIKNALTQFSNLIKEKGLLIIISDLLSSPISDLVRLLNYFVVKKFEVIVIQILDPYEIEFPFSLPTKFKDMETKKSISTEPKFIRDHYINAINELSLSFKNSLRKINVNYHLLQTNVAIEKNLFHIFITQTINPKL